MMKHIKLGLYLAIGLGLSAPGWALLSSGTEVSAARGAKTYGQFCATCHGSNMANPQSFAIDLRTFPADQHDRFVRSVMNGKGAMPAWDGVLKPTQAEDLWAFVTAVKAKPAAAKN